METSSHSALEDPIIGRAYNLIDDDTVIQIQDMQGNKLYIDTVAVVVNQEAIALRLIVAPF
jgi:hypothetical protein